MAGFTLGDFGHQILQYGRSRSVLSSGMKKSYDGMIPEMFLRLMGMRHDVTAAMLDQMSLASSAPLGELEDQMRRLGVDKGLHRRDQGSVMFLSRSSTLFNRISTALPLMRTRIWLNSYGFYIVIVFSECHAVQACSPRNPNPLIVMGSNIFLRLFWYSACGLRNEISRFDLLW